MRVIAGTYRSRRLLAPPGTATRPTSDRLRETLFNILAARVQGSTFVDLYAGTGAVGIEALSRGARFVYFAENAAAALKALRANLAALNITKGFAVEEGSAMALLRRLAPANGAGGADLVYLDPPYDDEAAYSDTLGLLGDGKLLAPDALVIAEHASRSRFTLPARAGGLMQGRILKQGDTTLTFYSPTAPPQTLPPRQLAEQASGIRKRSAGD